MTVIFNFRWGYIALAATLHPPMGYESTYEINSKPSRFLRGVIKLRSIRWGNFANRRKTFAAAVEKKTRKESTLRQAKAAAIANVELVKAIDAAKSSIRSKSKT